MNHEAFAKLMRQAGLTTADVARLTGKNRVTVWRWQRGDLAVPDYAVTILRQQVLLRTFKTQ